jgi:excisionase family DNA binding protein
MAKLRDRVYSPAEFADETGRSLSSVYDAIRKGEIPTVKIGRLYYITKVWAERTFGAAALS